MTDADFEPPTDPHSHPTELEKLRDQLAVRLQSCAEPVLDEFLTQLDSFPSPTVLVVLAMDELRFRQQRGESITFSDYVQRYPALENVDLQTLQAPSASNDAPSADSHSGAEAFQTRRSRSRPTVPVRPNRHRFDVGQTLDDFELLARLGEGAFAQVFLARQRSMHRLVALKVSADLGTEPQTLAQLDHPHIVRVCDQRSATEHAVHLLYMQYVAGGTLQEIMQCVHERPPDQWNGAAWVEAVDRVVIDRGETPGYNSPVRTMLIRSNWSRTVCELGRQLASALDYARRQKVLHRDIKPANILIGADCMAKLADFNISFWSDIQGANARTHFGGSLAYMSPEQLMAFNPAVEVAPDQLDHRSDLFSLGIILFELLTGRNPFSSETTNAEWTEQLKELTEARSRSAPLEWIQRDPSRPASPALVSALERCLQKEPDRRFDSAGELETQLRIGLDPNAEHLLYTPPKHPSRIIENRFLFISLLVAGLVNLLGVFFVREFNLLQSIPESAQTLFWRVQRIINWTAFPLAMVLFLYGTRRSWHILKARRQNRPIDDSAIGEAARNVIHSGNLLARLCAAEWIFAGVLYPTILTRLGVPMTWKGATDFVLSHALAGISITALTYFGLTWLSLRSWLPALIRDHYSEPVTRLIVSELERVDRRIGWYQVIAISVPSVAIALLVIVGNAQNKFALTVISLAGIIGIPLVFLANQQINRMIRTYRSVFADRT